MNTMQLGCKIRAELYKSSEKYRETVNKFDVWYMNSEVYERLDELEFIYKEANNKGKRMHGYYLLSSRMFMPKLKEVKIKDIKEHVQNIINRFPLIEEWELCHETFDDNGDFRQGNRYRKNLGNSWESSIYNVIKNMYPDKKFFYSDYIRTRSKARSIINFVNNTKAIDGFNFQIHQDIINPISPRLIRDIYKSIEKEKICLECVVWNTRKNFVHDRNTPKTLIRDIAKRGLSHLIHIPPNLSESLQSYRYRQLKRIALENNVSTFGIWCITDARWDAFYTNAWQLSPGILDIEFNEKKCYSSIFS